MSYHLSIDAPLADELRRVAREQLAKAVDELDCEPADLDAGVHQARKRCKKLRALLRLAHQPLGHDYTRLNTGLRDTARSLSRLRDASALIATTDRLLEQQDDAEFQSAGLALRRHLEEERNQIAANEDLVGLAATAACELRVFASRIDSWPLAEMEIEDLMPGLERTYRRGRETLPDAREGGAEAVHRWRKRSKYLWYHVRLLRDCWKWPLTSLGEELERLSQQLGDHHDLAVLQQVLDDLRSEEAMDEDQLQSIEDVIDAQSTRLLASALPLGERIWAERPKRFVRRIRAYWNAWEHESEPGRAAAVGPHSA